MSADHLILLSILVIYALGSVWLFGRILRDGHKSQESLEAIMQGQEHIAEIAGEVLRRIPNR